MKQFLLIITTTISSFLGAQSSPEKIAHTLDSIVKADHPKRILVFHGAMGAGNNQIKESVINCKFDGQFFVITDYPDNTKSYNLSKLLSYRVNHKSNKLELYFESK